MKNAYHTTGGKRTPKKRVKKRYLPQHETGFCNTTHRAVCLCCGKLAPVTNRFKKTGLCPACKAV